MLNQDFFQDDNAVLKKQSKRKISTKKPRKIKTPYSPTKIKARNYLSNISYSRICDDDFKNLSFIADALSFMTMDLKPFFLKITYGDEHDIDMIKMLWEECLPKSYLLHLKKPENFELINSEKSNFKTIKNLVVQQYMSSSENCQNLINSFQKYHDIYQYIYSHVFPKTYSKKAGFSKQVQFTQQFNSWKQKMQQSYLKSPFNFTTEQIRHPLEQKPIEINIYDDIDFKADVVDHKPLPLLQKKSPDRFLYAPTMVGNQDFDRKFKLPKQKKQKTSSEIENEKKILEAKLAENNQAMNQIKTGNSLLKKTIKKK